MQGRNNWYMRLQEPLCYRVLCHIFMPMLPGFLYLLSITPQGTTSCGAISTGIFQMCGIDVLGCEVPFCHLITS